MRLPRFFKFENYNIQDLKEFLTEDRVDIFLERDFSFEPKCHRCGGRMGAKRGDHFMKIETLPILGLRTFLHFRRFKFDCSTCKKVRSESVPFLSEETPRLSKEYAWWIGRLCEISPVSRVAELISHDGMTTWRVDFNRMIRLLSNYKIPKARRLSVDEVYARRKKKDESEDRDERFFTVISDLDTRRVIWVSFSRKKKALDEFFKIIGPDGCSRIEVVAADQHDAYAASVNEFCPRATLVWDRFHIMQNFEVAVNEVRKDLCEESNHDDVKQKARGRYKYLFLKKASRRTESEKSHLEEVMKLNQGFYKLELIKEKMMSFFDQPDLAAAKLVFEEIGDWIYQEGFRPLMDWYCKIEKGWETLRKYFEYRVTSALSEGINNVIKTMKRKAFGYRNMNYFRLKIMQVCGYLNSRYCSMENQ
jgi:transposase